MRISDWSSDVCSSDLAARPDRRGIEPWRRTRAGEAGAERRRRRKGPGRTAPTFAGMARREADGPCGGDRLAGSRLPGGRSEEHTSELQSLMRISYAVFCLHKKKMKQN